MVLFWDKIPNIQAPGRPCFGRDRRILTFFMSACRNWFFFTVCMVINSSSCLYVTYLFLVLLILLLSFEVSSPQRDKTWIMNLFVLLVWQYLRWPWYLFLLVGWELLVCHWSAFLALWLSTHGGYISNFLALSPIFLLLVWQIWLFSPFDLGVVNDSCTEHIYYCK